MNKNLKKILSLIVCITLVTSCGVNSKKSLNDKPSENQKVKIETDGNVYQDNMPASESDILSNIDVKFEKALSGQYVAFVTNNNTFAIPDLEINVNFSKNGAIVDTDNDGHDAVLPGYTVISEFESYESFDNADYEVSVNWNYGTSYINHSNDVKVKYNINSSKDAIVTITNNGSNEIEEIELIAVFYDSTGNLLGTSYSQDIYHIASKKSVTEKMTLKDYENSNKVDKVKIYLNQAHTF